MEQLKESYSMNFLKSLRLRIFFLSPISVGIIFFLLLQLQIFNLNINYRDEGFLLDIAGKISRGEIPYKDFSLAITPGAFYFQALIMKLFGSYMIVDRILYVFCVILLLILSSKLFRFSTYFNYVFLLSLGIIYAGERRFASYNVEALLLILAGFLLFNKIKEDSSLKPYSFLTGLVSFIIVVFKQSYGGIFFFTFLVLIFFFTKRKYLVKNLFYFLLGNLLLLSIFLLYFYLNNSLYELRYNLFSFASSVKNDRMPFILTSLLFIPFVLFTVNYMKKFSLKKMAYVLLFFFAFFGLYILIAPSRINYVFFFYKDISIYYFIFFFIAPIVSLALFFKSKDENKKNITVTSISALSIFLASSFSGRDYTTVIVVSPLYIPLIISFIPIFKKYRLSFINVTALALFILPSIFYLIQTYGKLYGIGFRREAYDNLDVKEAKYIRIPTSQKKDLESIVSYTKTTSANTKLLCFPYCPLFNFLTEKNNASYFNFFYKFRLEDQARVIRDMNDTKNLVVLLQRKGEIEKEADFEDKKLNVLRRHILTNYKLKKITRNFYIYSN